MNRKHLENQLTKSIASEFFGAKLGDDRRRDRLCTLSESLSENPALAFPQALVSDAELEGAYRFLANPNVSWEEIIKPHIDNTFLRLSEAADALVIHDTTQCSFVSGENKRGLGRLSGTKKKGFLCHLSLAVEFGPVALPLGAVNVHSYRRLGPSRGKRSHKDLRHDKSKESLRWWQAIQNVDAKAKKKVIHVMDREADAYWLLSELISNEDKFVVRISKNRGVEAEEDLLFEQMNKAPFVCEREIRVSSRKKGTTPRMQKAHPSRKARVVKLGISSQTVTIKRGRQVGAAFPRSLPVNVILVKELSPPEGEEPIDWKLTTSEPVETPEEILRVVDIYRSRWLIEEYFKALKTGCSYEQRQLESYHSLVNALAIFIPIAWRILLLRSLEREAPQEAGTEFLIPQQIPILRAASKRPVPENPSVHDVFLAIAGLGGHIKNNGSPGWQVLWRGYQKFLNFEKGWNAAMRCANVINC